MQFKSSILAIALAVTAVSAQLEGLPQCAQAPALASIGDSGCQLTDIACICKNQAFLSGLQTKVATACTNPTDQAAAAAFAVKLCASAGVSLAVPGPASTTAAPVSTSAVAVVTTTVAPTYTTSYVAAGTGTGTGVPAPSGNGTVVVPPTPTSSIVTGAAPVQGVQAGLALLMGVVGAVVAL